jgi:bifunctional NMN adenylyltransferase/nudix hydrolase
MTADTTVLIGRWQILQRGHVRLLRVALASAPRVIVVIGAAFRSRDCRNPFTWEERRQQFEAVLDAPDRARVQFLPVRDYYDDQRWGEAVRAGIERLAGRTARIALVRYQDDHTATYLEQFPLWSLIDAEPEQEISSTDLQHIYFGSADLRIALAVMSPYLEPAVHAYLEAWAHLPAYRRCAAEEQAVEAYRRKYTAPFYLTADALVCSNAHVLLVRRGGPVGEGLLALPGGFLEPSEQLYPAALRELAEETGYRPLPALMRQALRGSAVFDHPLRSPRGRIVTEAFHFELQDSHLPEVRGRDDAKEAKWIPIVELPRLESQLFEDHACILDHFLNTFPPA